MRVTFLQDFRGRETKERYYREGEKVNLVADVANDLAERGIVRKPAPRKAKAKDGDK